MSFVFHCKKTSLKKYWLCLDTATRLRHSLFIWFLKWTWWKVGWNMARLLLECDVDYVSVWIQLIVTSAFLSCGFLFLFFFLVQPTLVEFSTVNSAFVHCSGIYKFYFSATFSLKIGPTILFTHLKIILLQYFSVFNFQLYLNG